MKNQNKGKKVREVKDTNFTIYIPQFVIQSELGTDNIKFGIIWGDGQQLITAHKDYVYLAEPMINKALRELAKGAECKRPLITPLPTKRRVTKK